MNTTTSTEPFSVPLASVPAFARLADQPRTAVQRFESAFQSQLTFFRSLRSKDERGEAFHQLSEQLAQSFPRIGKQLETHPALAVLLGLSSGAVAALLRALPEKPTSGPLLKVWEAAEQKLGAAMEKLSTEPHLENNAS